LGGVERKFVVNCLSALGRADLIEAALTPPGPTQAPVKAFLSEVFRNKTRDEWVAWFADKDVCFAPVLDLHEAFHQPQITERDMLVRDVDGNLHIGLPIRFAEEPGRLNPAIPKLDEHRAEILSRLAKQP
jgi:crotonobetainyl-CoA:carnitine CoA-transferase CaiB-like acyl-CoA transferase